MKPPGGTSETIGSGARQPNLSVVGTRGSGTGADFCFVFGCGSSVNEALCLDRTGTGIVVLVVARGSAAMVEVPGVGSIAGSVIRVGFLGSTGEPTNGRHRDDLDDEWYWVVDLSPDSIRFEEREKPRQMVQMHNGPSQVMIKGTTLSVVHRGQE